MLERIVILVLDPFFQNDNILGILDLDRESARGIIAEN